MGRTRRPWLRRRDIRCRTGNCIRRSQPCPHTSRIRKRSEGCSVRRGRPPPPLISSEHPERERATEQAQAMLIFMAYPRHGKSAGDSPSGSSGVYLRHRGKVELLRLQYSKCSVRKVKKTTVPPREPTGLFSQDPRPARKWPATAPYEMPGPEEGCQGSIPAGRHSPGSGGGGGRSVPRVIFLTSRCQCAQ